MTSFKYFILFFGTLASVSSFAGGGGGGGVMESASKVISLSGNDFSQMLAQTKEPMIIYSIGQKDGQIKLVCGKLVENQWNLQNIAIPNADVSLNPQMIQAITQSSAVKNWVLIK